MSTVATPKSELMIGCVALGDGVVSSSHATRDPRRESLKARGDQDRVAWRVGTIVDGENAWFTDAFERQQDAERAKAALERAGLLNAMSIWKAGAEKCRQIMFESLPW